MDNVQECTEPPICKSKKKGANRPQSSIHTPLPHIDSASASGHIPMGNDLYESRCTLSNPNAENNDESNALYLIQRSP